MSIDLDAIEARAKAATPGPWIMDAEEQTVRAVEADGQPIMCDRSTETWAEDNNANDCDFISHAREDVPALLAEVKRLNAELQEEDANETTERNETMESNVLKAVEEISGYTPDEMIAMYNDYERMAKECEACAALKERTRWIPVSERLPENSGTYLVYLGMPDKLIFGNGVHTAWYYGGSRTFSFSLNTAKLCGLDSSAEIRSTSVTHWMPLPSAPDSEVANGN